MSKDNPKCDPIILKRDTYLETTFKYFENLFKFKIAFTLIITEGY